MNLGERLRDYFSPRQRIETSPGVSDEVKCTTCYMCACRCGIKVHLKNGGIRYIEGNRDHPVNRGVICGKGASGIMQQHSPGNRMGGGDLYRCRVVVTDPRTRPEKTRIFHWA